MDKFREKDEIRENEAEKDKICGRNAVIEAIKAGREYSNHKMNQCIAVSISGVSLFSELKMIAVFAVFAYVAAMVFSISKKFPKS